MQTFLNFFWNKDEKRLRAFWRLLLQIFILLTLMILVTLPLLGFRLITGQNLDSQEMAVISQTLSTLLSGIAIMASIWVCGRWIDRRPFSNFGFHFSTLWKYDLIFGLLLGAFLMVFIFLTEYLLGWIEIKGTFLNNNPSSSFVAGLFGSVLLFLAVGIYEEAFSRGYQLRNLAEGFKFFKLNKQWALAVAWLLSSSFFGLLHLGNPNSNLISTLNLIVAGLFLGLGFVLTGDLGISIGLHITWNFFQGNVFGFPVSGTKTMISFIGITQKGTDLMTGGSFGPEAGIIGLIAMILGSLLILGYVYKTRKSLRLNTELAEYTPNY